MTIVNYDTPPFFVWKGVPTKENVKIILNTYLKFAFIFISRRN